MLEDLLVNGDHDGHTSSDCDSMAIGASAVHEEFMARNGKSTRQFGFHFHFAAREFKELAADVALEVMVMPFARHFIARCLPWNLNRN